MWPSASTTLYVKPITHLLGAAPLFVPEQHSWRMIVAHLASDAREPCQEKNAILAGLQGAPPYRSPPADPNPSLLVPSLLFRTALYSPIRGPTGGEAPWPRAVSWCGPRCPIRPTGQNSMTGTRPITCLGRSRLSGRNGAGGAGAAPTPPPTMPFTNSPMSERRRR